MKKVLTTRISGHKLSEYREKAELTQDELAQKLGFSRTTIVNWENKTSIKVENNVLKKIEAALNVTSKELTNVPRGTDKGEAIENHPLVKSYVSEIASKDKIIALLEAEIERLRSQK